MNLIFSLEFCTFLLSLVVQPESYQKPILVTILSMSLLEDETLEEIVLQKPQHKIITVCKCQALKILSFCM